jgi:hypothetical protein
MKVLIVLATVIAVSSAGPTYPAAYVQSYAAVPSVLTHSRVSVPVEIPTTVPEVVNRL